MTVRRIPPGPGQTSVWDHPRPPRVERERRPITIRFGGGVVATTEDAWRVLETSHPPVYYLPRAAFVDGALEAAAGSSFCEWKGRAVYFDVVHGGRRARRAAFAYPEPTPGFAAIADHVAVYAGPMDACLVGDERARPQPGDFYAGWITDDVVGPFKGGPGTAGW